MKFIIFLFCFSTLAFAITPQTGTRTSHPYEFVRNENAKSASNGGEKVTAKKSNVVPARGSTVEPSAKYAQGIRLSDGEIKKSVVKAKETDEKKSGLVRIKKEDGSVASFGYFPGITSQVGHVLPHGNINFAPVDQFGYPLHGGYYDSGHHTGYVQEPEPIIEIIIKESNQSLPAPPPPPPPKKKKKEPVQVYYVKYKKEPSSHYGEGKIVYEPPVPAITPPTNNENPHEEEETAQGYGHHHEVPVTLPPRPRTTLKAIIRPDSETYHGNGIRVTFGGPHDDDSSEYHPTAGGNYEEQSAPQPSVVLPPTPKSNGALKTNFESQLKKRNPVPFQSQTQSPQQLFQGKSSFSIPNGFPRAPAPAATFPHTNRFGLRPQPFAPSQSSNVESGPPPPPSSSSSQVYATLPHVQPFPKPQSSFAFPTSRPRSSEQPGFSSPVRGTQQLYSINQPHLKATFNINAGPSPQTPYRTISSRVTQQSFPKVQAAPLPATTPQPFQQTTKPQPQSSSLFSKPTHSFGPQQQPTSFPRTNPLISQSSFSQSQGVFGSVPRNPNVLPQSPSAFPPQPQHSHQLQLNRLQPQKQQLHQQQQQLQQEKQQLHHQQQQLQQQRHQLQQQQHQFRQQQQHQHQLQQNQNQAQQFNQQQRQNQLEQLNRQHLEKLNQQHRQHQLDQINRQQLEKFNQQQRQQQLDILSQHHRQQQSIQLGQQQNQQLEQLIQLQRRQQLEQFNLLQRQQRPQGQTIQNQQAQSTFAPDVVKSISSDFAYDGPLFASKSQSQSLTVRPQLIQNGPNTPRYSGLKNVPTATEPSARKHPELTTRPAVEYITEDPEVERRKKEEKRKQNVAALPDEVPDDLRKQLLSSDILGNADIEILDYDKIGDIPIDKLPPEALANFQAAAGSRNVPAVARPDPEDEMVAEGSEQRGIAVAPPRLGATEMKVVRYDSKGDEGAKVADRYVQPDATQLDPVVLNDSRYNRYLPLKVAGAQFPVPDVPELRGKNITSVVVLAPVDYQFLQRHEDVVEDEGRNGRSSHPVLEVQGVHFVAGDILKTLVKKPTAENYRIWLDKENKTSVDKQSVVLLVIEPKNNSSSEKDKEIFMFDIGSQRVSKLSGELSSQFVEVAESNSENDDLDEISDGQQTSFRVKDASEVTPGHVRKQRKAVIVDSSEKSKLFSLR